MPLMKEKPIQMKEKPIEIVLLCGPVCVGKTSYYSQHLSITHSRICQEEIYKSSKSAGLRQVCLKAVEQIKKEKSIVIEGEFRFSQEREDCIRTILEKIEQKPWSLYGNHLKLTFSCLHLLPKHGFSQCQWALQWGSAEQTERKSNQQSSAIFDDFKDCESYEKLLDSKNDWFENNGKIKGSRYDTTNSEIALREETFESVPLKCSSQYELNQPAFFIAFDSLFKTSDDDLPVLDKTKEILVAWTDLYIGRVIVCIDAKPCASLKYSLECTNSKNYLSRCIEKILELSESIDYPIYFLTLFNDSPRNLSYGLPPKCTGYIAWLQRRHLIDIGHGGTIHSISSKSQRLACEETFITYFEPKRVDNIKEFLDTLNKDKKRFNFLENIEYVNLGEKTNEVTIPLFNSFPQETIVTESFYEEENNQMAHYTHGVCCKDWSTFLKRSQPSTSDVCPVELSLLQITSYINNPEVFEQGKKIKATLYDLVFFKIPQGQTHGKAVIKGKGKSMARNLTITLADGVVSSNCTCSVTGNVCKHIAFFLYSKCRTKHLESVTAEKRGTASLSNVENSSDTKHVPTISGLNTISDVTTISNAPCNNTQNATGVPSASVKSNERRKLPSAFWKNDKIPKRKSEKKERKFTAEELLMEARAIMIEIQNEKRDETEEGYDNFVPMSQVSLQQHVNLVTNEEPEKQLRQDQQDEDENHIEQNHIEPNHIDSDQTEPDPTEHMEKAVDEIESAAIINERSSELTQLQKRTSSICHSSKRLALSPSPEMIHDRNGIKEVLKLFSSSDSSDWEEIPSRDTEDLMFSESSENRPQPIILAQETDTDEDDYIDLFNL